MAKPTKSLSFEVQNLKARAMNAERMVKKLTDERKIMRAWSISKNYLIVILLISLILNLVF